MTIDIIKILIPAVLAFFVGIGITPIITDFLYKNQMWKKKVKSIAVDGSSTPIFASLHKDKEIGTPRLGGSVIWLSAFAVATLIWTLSKGTSFEIFDKIEFVSRNQTWIPFFTLLFGAIVGAIDDIFEIKGIGGHIAGGLSLKKRLFFVSLVGFLIGTWFFVKLEVVSIFLPFIGYLTIGWLIVPLFVLVMLFMYSGGVIDGIDGLAGGVFTVAFAAYSIIALSNGQIDLAAFCALLVGAILAFLWFNIPPARFYMSETGSMALTITLTVVAFMTDHLGDGRGLMVLPLVALPLVLTTLSVIIQLLSKKLRNGKKIFLSTPIHHHFEAIGWPSYKVTMRYWIFAVIFATLGVIFAIIG
jgi:phospho-N-acetylmuramoyl-pentapeptide-transferase